MNRWGIGFWAGLAVSICVIAAIEFGRVTKSPIPIPFLLLYMTIVLSANVGGLVSGLASAGLASAFVVWSSLHSFGPATLTGGPTQVLFGTLLFFGTAAVIGRTRQQNAKYLNELLDHEIALEERVAWRTEQLEGANRELERLRRRTLDFATTNSDGFFELDEVLRISKFELHALGRQDEVLEFPEGVSLIDLEPNVHEPPGWRDLKEALENRTAFRDLELQMEAKSAEAIWVSLSATPKFHSTGEFLGYRGVASDITERCLLEQRVRESERLDSIAKLTRGLGHDFNNLLAVIKGHAQLIARRRDPTACASSATAILEASERGVSLVRQLSRFGRGGTESSKTAVSVEDGLKEIEKLLDVSVGTEITLEFDVPASLWPVFCDPTEFDNAILNLTINARDAMPEGGAVRIEGENFVVSQWEKSVDLEPGNYVCVKVRDTGTGIAPEISDRLFEPFATTKSERLGTGLGLSMVRDFVRRSGGVITVDSVLGSGSVFSMYLPRSQDSNGSEQIGKDHAQSDTVPRQIGARVLVVEDNLELLAATSDHLRSEGFEVEEASSGEQAMSLLKGAKPFDFLFADVMLPGRLSGVDIANEGQALFPKLPILLTSGHIATASVGGYPERVLAKPYDADELVGSIYRMLAGHRTDAAEA